MELYQNFYGFELGDQHIPDKKKLIIKNAKVLKIERSKFIKTVGADQNQSLREFSVRRMGFLRRRIKYLSDINKASLKEDVEPAVEHLPSEVPKPKISEGWLSQKAKQAGVTFKKHAQVEREKEKQNQALIDKYIKEYDIPIHDQEDDFQLQNIKRSKSQQLNWMMSNSNTEKHLISIINQKPQKSHRGIMDLNTPGVLPVDKQSSLKLKIEKTNVSTRPYQVKPVLNDTKSRDLSRKKQMFEKGMSPLTYEQVQKEWNQKIAKVEKQIGAITTRITAPSNLAFYDDQLKPKMSLKSVRETLSRSKPDHYQNSMKKMEQQFLLDLELHGARGATLTKETLLQKSKSLKVLRSPKKGILFLHKYLGKSVVDDICKEPKVLKGFIETKQLQSPEKLQESLLSVPSRIIPTKSKPTSV